MYLERDYVRSGFEAVGRWAEVELGVRGLAEKAHELFATGRRGTTLGDALEALTGPVSGDVVLQLVHVYRNHCPTIRMLPDAAKLLEVVSERSRVAVLTDGLEASQRAKLKALGIAAVADPVVVTEALGADYRKPSTRAFALIEATLQACGDQLVYVADNPLKDFIAPAQLR